MPYGIIENGKCINAIEADETFALSLGAVEIPDGYWIGDYYDGEWYHEKPTTEAQALGQQITDEQLERIEMGQAYTDLELALLEQGQKITDVELGVLKNV